MTDRNLRSNKGSKTDDGVLAGESPSALRIPIPKNTRIAPGLPKTEVTTVPSKQNAEGAPSSSDSDSTDESEGDEEAIAGEIIEPPKEPENEISENHPERETQEYQEQPENMGIEIELDSARIETSFEPHANDEDSVSQNNLNRAQKGRIHKRRNRRSPSLGRDWDDGPSQDKGKGPDPRNWGGAQDISEEEYEAQQVLLENAAANRHVKIEEPVRGRKRTDKHKDVKPDNALSAKRSGAASRNVDNIISISTSGRVRRRSSKGSRGRKGSSGSRKKSFPRPTEQIDKNSYINDAFKRSKKLDGRASERKGKPGDSDSSDSESSDEGTDPPSHNASSEEDSFEESSGDESSDPSDNSDDEEGMEVPRKRNKSSFKPIPPPIYDGSPSMPRFHQFMLSSTMYLDDAGVPKNRRVYRLHTFLRGKAYSFYAQEVSYNVTKWSVTKFFQGLFDACFPVDFKEKQREKLESFKQNNMEIRSYWSQLTELFLTTGVRRDREKARYFWHGLRPETKLRLRYDGISPENSSLERMIRKAENAELAWRLQRAQNIENERAVRKDYKDSFSEKRYQKRNKGNRHGSRFGKRTNGYTSETNSNKERARKLSRRYEPPRRDTRTKHNHAQLSAAEKSRLKAEGKCYICKEATNPPHMARNCPKANSVNSKGSRSSQVQSYGVYVDHKDAETCRSLAETTEEIYETTLGLNMMGWAPESNGDDDSDNSSAFDEVGKRPGWRDEVENILYEFHSEEEYIPDKNPLRRKSSSTDSWPSLYEMANWQNPTKDSPWYKAVIGDPVKESIEESLVKGAPYAQDRHRGCRSGHRFAAVRSENGYIILDEHHEALEGETFVAWDLARKPEFNIADWYQKRLDSLFGLPTGRRRTNRKFATRKRHDMVSEAIELFLNVGGPYVGEWQRVYDIVERFEANYDPKGGDYIVVDHALQFQTKLKAELLRDEDFSVANWYNEVLERAYLDLWANLVLCWPEEVQSSEDDEEVDVFVAIQRCEEEAFSQQFSQWHFLDERAVVTHIGGAPESWGTYPAVQLSDNGNATQHDGRTHLGVYQNQ